jgi:uncharacterized membrane protein YqjE
MLRRPSEPSGEARSLGGLIEDLLGQLAQFLDQKLSLLRLELEHNLAQLIRHLVVLVIGGAVAGLGLILLAMALAFWIAGQLGSASAGFGVTGIVFLAIGAIIVGIRVGRGVDPSRRRALSQTTTELRKDSRWLGNGR